MHSPYDPIGQPQIPPRSLRISIRKPDLLGFLSWGSVQSKIQAFYTFLESACQSISLLSSSPSLLPPQQTRKQNTIDISTTNWLMSPTSRKGSVIVFDPVTQTMSTEKLKHLGWSQFLFFFFFGIIFFRLTSQSLLRWTGYWATDSEVAKPCVNIRQCPYRARTRETPRRCPQSR